MKKTAIFDMDGTIIDSMPKWGTVIEDYFKDLGIVFTDDYKKSLIGLSMHNIINNIKTDFGLSEDPNESYHNILGLMLHGYINEFALKPGVIDCLENLKADGIKMAVATATPEHIAVEALKAKDLIKYFEFVQTCDNINHHKNDPMYWKKAALRLESDMPNTVVFEDALYCIETVSNLNGNIIAISDEASFHDEEIIKSLANQFIKSYDELDYDIFK